MEYFLFIIQLPVSYFLFFTASEKNALHRMFAWLESAREDYIRSAVELKQYASEDLEGHDPPESSQDDEGDDDDDDDVVDWRVVGGKRKFKVRKKNQYFFDLFIHCFLIYIFLFTN